MNIRSRTEKELVENLNQNLSIQEVYFDSTASKADTNLILAKILNQIHSLNDIRLVSTFYQIHKISSAA